MAVAIEEFAYVAVIGIVYLAALLIYNKFAKVKDEE